jgi:hypothetical protein
VFVRCGVGWVETYSREEARRYPSRPSELVTTPISLFSHNLDDEEWILIFAAVKRVDLIG